MTQQPLAMIQQPLARTQQREDGSAVVDVVLVSVLVVVLFLVVAQVALTLHVRNVLVAAAAEGARYAANADRDPVDGQRRARDAVADALSDGLADRMSDAVTQMAGPGGASVIEVQVIGPLPVVLLPFTPITLSVRGHALEEQR